MGASGPPGHLRGTKKRRKRKIEEKIGKERKKLNQNDKQGAIQAQAGGALRGQIDGKEGGGSVRAPFFNFAPGRQN